MFFFNDEKEIVSSKQHLIISHIIARLFFIETCMFHKVSKLCPHFLSTDIHVQKKNEIKEYQGHLSLNDPLATLHLTSGSGKFYGFGIF